mmetsp:Transcript_36437/g.96104  ORF Transcript_36437/g.96104 Transcript_36437/m.96104 type:complete len:227 (+) Transcript_36437:162-842(+)
MIQSLVLDLLVGHFTADHYTAVIENHRCWAHLQGFDHHTVRGHSELTSWADRPLKDRKHSTGHWLKFPAISQAFSNGYKFVLFVDMDAIFISNSSFRSLVAQAGEASFWFSSGNGNVINSGVMGLRATHWSKWLLKEAWAIGDTGHPIKDNAALAMILGGCRRTSSDDELKRCYARSDQGYNNRTLLKKLKAGLLDAETGSMVTSGVPLNELKLFSRTIWQGGRLF